MNADSISQDSETNNFIDGEDIDTTFKLLISSDATIAAAAATEMHHRIRTNSLRDLVLKAYMEKAGLKLFASRQKNLSTLKKWLEEPPERRPYFHLTKPQLIAICVSRLGNSASSYNKEGKEELVQLLATRHFFVPTSAAGRSSTQRRRSSNNTSSVGLLRTSLLKKIIEASFLPKLTAKGKEYCKLGLQLEGPFGKKLLQHSSDGITKFKVEGLYRVGLVGRGDEMYAKASTDFVAIAIVEGVETLVAIECKARVTPGTHQREREHGDLLFRRQENDHHRSTTGSSSTSDLYTVIEASSNDFHKYVNSSHEAVQLMHTAYVYSFEYVLLLVGDSSGSIIRGKFY